MDSYGVFFESRKIVFERGKMEVLVLLWLRIEFLCLRFGEEIGNKREVGVGRSKVIKDKR